MSKLVFFAVVLAVVFFVIAPKVAFGFFSGLALLFGAGFLLTMPIWLPLIIVVGIIALGVRIGSRRTN